MALSQDALAVWGELHGGGTDVTNRDDLAELAGDDDGPLDDARLSAAISELEAAGILERGTGALIGFPPIDGWTACYHEDLGALIRVGVTVFASPDASVGSTDAQVATSKVESRSIDSVARVLRLVSAGQRFKASDIDEDFDGLDGHDLMAARMKRVLAALQVGDVAEGDDPSTVLEAIDVLVEMIAMLTAFATRSKPMARQAALALGAALSTKLANASEDLFRSFK